MSFAEAGSTSRTSSEHGPSVKTVKNGQSAAGHVRPDYDSQNTNLDASSLPNRPASGSPQRPKSSSSSHGSPDRRRTVDDLQNGLVPATTKDLFARAADIMRRSNDMSGVMFLDASYASRGSQGTSPLDTGKRCQILGFAMDEESSLKGDSLPMGMTPHESNFKWVLDHYPNGYSLSCDTEDEATFDGHIPSQSLFSSAENSREGKGLQAVVKDREMLSARVKKLIPDFKSALFLPLWDFERGRWFAGCFCWSTRTERVLDGRLDLPFLKAFGHSIMQEVARLDATTTNQSKSTFLSSLSHELRTPLHGVLGSVHLMRNSRLDSFQSSMLNAITICGRTLLETVEHLLDHAERPETRQNYSSTVSHGERSICISSERLNVQTLPSEASDKPKCNVGFVTEEVVETMIVGESPFDMTLETNNHEELGKDQSLNHTIARRRSRFIILDISDYEGLGFSLSASSFGRIVMNLFGNALKFTETGYVHVTVRSENLSNDRGTVVLSISDSGVGMTRPFLQEKAFEPFRKQNEHTAGTGVGLAVVRRILEDIGGTIDVTSAPSEGTDIVLKLQLERLTEEEGHEPKINPLSVAMSGLKGRKVCVLYAGSDPNDSPEQTLHRETVKRYVDVLTATLSNVLQVDIYNSSTWDGTDDTEVVICPEISFESLQMVRDNAAKAGRPCPATVLVAMDLLEAETIRCDARVQGKQFVVETITQP
jgi:signal transduction histidine kinase